MEGDIVESLHQAVLVLALSTTRVAAAVVVVPFAGGQLLTGTARNAVVLSLSVVVCPAAAASLDAASFAMPALLAIVVKEIILGVLVGYLAGLVFWAAEGVGYGQANDLVARIVEGHQQGQRIVDARVGIDQQGDFLGHGPIMGGVRPWNGAAAWRSRSVGCYAAA